MRVAECVLDRGVSLLFLGFMTFYRRYLHYRHILAICWTAIGAVRCQDGLGRGRYPVSALNFLVQGRSVHGRLVEIQLVGIRLKQIQWVQRHQIQFVHIYSGAFHPPPPFVGFTGRVSVANRST